MGYRAQVVPPAVQPPPGYTTVHSAAPGCTARSRSGPRLPEEQVLGSEGSYSLGKSLLETTRARFRQEGRRVFSGFFARA